MKTEFFEVSPRTGLIIGLAMLLAGLLFTGWKYPRILAEINSLRWIKTSGVVESSNFYTSSRKSGTKTITTHHGEVTYRYSVDDFEYVGQRYDAAGHMHTGLEGKVRKFKNLINASSEIEVFYDPDDPSQSLLKNGISEDTLVRLVFSLFLSTVGMVVLSYQWKRYKKQQAEQLAPPTGE